MAPLLHRAAINMWQYLVATQDANTATIEHPIEVGYDLLNKLLPVNICDFEMRSKLLKTS